jgi:hypothetical protein
MICARDRDPLGSVDPATSSDLPFLFLDGTRRPIIQVGALTGDSHYGLSARMVRNGRNSRISSSVSGKNPNRV